MAQGTARLSLKETRALAALPDEGGRVRFVVGSLSLREGNTVTVVDYDPASCALRAQAYGHLQEVWHLSPGGDGLLATCHSDATGKGHRASLWRYPTSTVPLEGRQHPDLDHVVEFPTPDSTVLQVLWPPSGAGGDAGGGGGGGSPCGGVATVEARGFRTWDLAGGSPAPATALSPAQTPLAAISAGCWDPFSPGVVALAAGTAVCVVDTRSPARGLVNEAAHVMPARDVQYNPRRRHSLVTCGDGCAVKFWDARRLVAPALEFGAGHSHWVWQARYNPFHDQLVLSASSDTTVVLWSAESVSSAFGGGGGGGDAAAAGAPAAAPAPSAAAASGAAPSDGLLLRVEHEESCYAAAWSSADPWVWASASYDGALLVQQVPRSVRYRVAL